jgi:hypothetical protein
MADEHLTIINVGFRENQSGMIEVTTVNSAAPHSFRVLLSASLLSKPRATLRRQMPSSLTARGSSLEPGK